MAYKFSESTVDFWDKNIYYIWNYDINGVL